MTHRADAKAILLAFAGIYIIWGTTFVGIAFAIHHSAVLQRRTAVFHCRRPHVRLAAPA